jgi:ATP-dependent protease HslVU (ClpYQ) ATPase subunit
MTTLLDEIMFDAPDCDRKIKITKAMVTDKLSAIVQDKDLSRYIL